MILRLYLLSQSDRVGWGTYDSCVVAAENEEDALTINPASGWDSDAWASSPDRVTAKFLGVADNTVVRDIVIASFNAGII
jgi:hypothetical protein